MEQTDARRLAREVGAETGMIAVAVTKDRYQGRWDQTHEWGVSIGGHWYGNVVALREAHPRP